MRCGLGVPCCLLGPITLACGFLTVRCLTKRKRVFRPRTQFILFNVTRFPQHLCVVFCGTTGDLDVSITGVDGPQIYNLRLLTVCLTRLGIPLAVEVISSARVPIVKFIDAESGISVDLSLNTDSAMATTEYVLAQVSALAVFQLFYHYATALSSFALILGFDL